MTTADETLMADQAPPAVEQNRRTFRRWMRELPRFIEFRMAGLRLRVVHGGVDSINQFVFASHDAALKLAQIHAADVDVILVAPKGSGTTVRRLFVEGRGINASFAVHQDTTVVVA